MVLHIGRTELRLGLIVTTPRGTADLLHVVSATWNKEDFTLPEASAVDALASSLKSLVVSERLAGCSATLVLDSMHCVNRVAAGSSQEVKASLDEIDERSQHYLSLGPGVKTIATAVTNLDARHDRAVVSIACEETIEELIRVADAAGLDLRVIEAETVALARAHGALHKDDEQPVILAWCEGGRYEISVAHKGSLLLDYRPGTRSTEAGLLGVLNKHHARLERFSQRQTSDFSAELTKVYLAGNAADVRNAAVELQSDGRFDASPLDTGAALAAWPRAPKTLGVDAAVLVGRLLREIGAAPESPTPNLIERWIAESRKHIRPMLIRSALPIAATLLLAAVGAFVNWRVQAGTQQLDEQLAMLQPAQLEHNVLRLKMIAAGEKLERLKALSEGVEKANLAQLLAEVGGCLPDDVWLERLTLTDVASARVAGASYSESGVYEFVRHMNAAPRFDQVALEGTGFKNTREGPATSFDVKFVLATPEGGTP